MTVLSASQDAIARLLGRRPPSVFSSQDEICVEIASLSNEAATDIMKGHDWRKLTRVHEIISNGVDGSYPMPLDYDRMTVAAQVQNPTNYIWGYHYIPTVDDWINLQDEAWNAFPGAWIMLDGLFQFYPVPENGQMAKFPYVSSYYALATDGTTRKAAFTVDSDTFMLSERLLTLALIWRWKAMKLMDYQEDMRNYEVALSQEQGRDFGARVIRKGNASGANLRSPFGPLY